MIYALFQFTINGSNNCKGLDITENPILFANPFIKHRLCGRACFELTGSDWEPTGKSRRSLQARAHIIPLSWRWWEEVPGIPYGRCLKPGTVFAFNMIGSITIYSRASKGSATPRDTKTKAGDWMRAGEGEGWGDDDGRQGGGVQVDGRWKGVWQSEKKEEKTEICLIIICDQTDIRLTVGSN